MRGKKMRVEISEKKWEYTKKWVIVTLRGEEI